MVDKKDMTVELKVALNVMLNHCVEILSDIRLPEDEQYLMDVAANVEKAKPLLLTTCYRCEGQGWVGSNICGEKYRNCPRCKGTGKCFCNGFLPKEESGICGA